MPFLRQVLRFSLVGILNLAAISAAVATAARAEVAPATFASDDRWVAIGDSITQSGIYARHVELFHVLRAPDAAPIYLNAGISGDSAAGALRRFDWDIVPADAPVPTVATVMLGMNDCGRDLYAANLAADPATEDKKAARIQNYATNLRALVDRLQAAKLRVILFTPSPFDDTSTIDTPNLPGANSALAQCADIVRALATERSLGLVDLHAPLTALNHRLQAADPASTIIGRDRVHPGAPGHFAMAYQILKTQHAAGPFARVEIDASKLAVSSAAGATVSYLGRDTSVASTAGLRFAYLAEGLPFPVPTDARPALGWVPFSEELNREELRVSGLPRGRHRVVIDETELGVFTESELAQGIDLAALDTPQRRQAEAVRALLDKRWAALVKLRRIAEVEHGQASSLKHPITLAAMEPILAAWEARLLEKPSWQSKQPAEYRAWKPLAAELVAESDRLLAEARAAARPVLRRVFIKPAPAS